MNKNLLRNAFAVTILLAAAGCKATVPRLPTGPAEGPDVPPSSGFLAPAHPAVYV